MRVTNPANNRSVIVKINDRGPFHGKRILDLSRAAAESLGFVKQGHTKVKIERILPDKPDPYITVKDYDNRAEAEAMLERVRDWLRSQNTEQKAVILHHDQKYWVQVGPFDDDGHEIKEYLRTM